MRRAGGERTVRVRVELELTVTARGYYDPGRWAKPEDSCPEEGECEIASLSVLGCDLPPDTELPETARSEIEEAFFDALQKEEGT